jgi:hypothetical protein
MPMSRSSKSMAENRAASFGSQRLFGEGEPTVKRSSSCDFIWIQYSKRQITAQIARQDPTSSQRQSSSATFPFSHFSLKNSQDHHNLHSPQKVLISTPHPLSTSSITPTTSPSVTLCFNFLALALISPFPSPSSLST